MEITSASQETNNWLRNAVLGSAFLMVLLLSVTSTVKVLCF